jgi:protein-tyrosine phosphatase
MIDLHSHTLPGIDDGARDLGEAVAMCSLAAADGCAAVVATPHQRHDVWSNTDREALAAQRGEVERAASSRPRLLLGAEIRVDDEILADLGRLPESGLLSLAGSRYLLLELDRRAPSAPPPADLVHELVIAGWRPILAHPEFIPWLVEDPPLLTALTARGAHLQVTAMSVTGDFGRGPQETCARLLDAGLVDFVASDAHSSAWRPPGLRRAFEYISARWGPETALRVTTVNPAAVLEDRPLEGPGEATR